MTGKDDGPLGLVSGGIGRLVGRVAPTVIDSVDVDGLVERIDVDALVQRVDVAALVERVDLDALLAKVDIQALLQRIDLNAMLAEVDLNAIMAGVDVQALAKRADIGRLVSESSQDVAGSALDLARRQVVTLDVLLTRVAHRLTGRKDRDWPAGPPALVPLLAGETGVVQ